jgi:hypothetical protein
MTSKVKIQVQDQFGKWQNYSTVSGYPSSIKQGLQAALNSQMGRNSGKARAISAQPVSIIDMSFSK